MRRLAASLVLMGSATAAWADQTPPPPAPPNLPSVAQESKPPPPPVPPESLQPMVPAEYQTTVTALRLPRPLPDVPSTVTVLPREELERTPALGMDELVRLSPAATTFRRTPSLLADPTSQGLSLRAVGPSGVSRALVLVDGVPANDPFGGWIYWRALPRLGLDHIEVVPGGSSRPVRQLRPGWRGAAGRPGVRSGVRRGCGRRQPGHRQRGHPPVGPPGTGGGRHRARWAALRRLHPGGPRPARPHRHRRREPARRRQRPGRAADGRSLAPGRPRRPVRRGAERRHRPHHRRGGQRHLRPHRPARDRGLGRPGAGGLGQHRAIRPDAPAHRRRAHVGDGGRRAESAQPRRRRQRGLDQPPAGAGRDAPADGRQRPAPRRRHLDRAAEPRRADARLAHPASGRGRTGFPGRVRPGRLRPGGVPGAVGGGARRLVAQPAGAAAADPDGRHRDRAGVRRPHRGRAVAPPGAAGAAVAADAGARIGLPGVPGART